MMQSNSELTFETACQLANELDKTYLPRDLRFRLGLEQDRLKSLLATLEGTLRERSRAESKMRCVPGRCGVEIGHAR